MSKIARNTVKTLRLDEQESPLSRAQIAIHDNNNIEWKASVLFETGQ